MLDRFQRQRLGEPPLLSRTLDIGHAACAQLRMPVGMSHILALVPAAYALGGTRGIDRDPECALTLAPAGACGCRPVLRDMHPRLRGNQQESQLVAEHCQRSATLGSAVQ